MKRSKFKDHVTSFLSDIEKDLKCYKEKKEPEWLHELRVKTKKIKAVISFSEHENKKKIVKKLKSLKKIYKKAGKIRDLQLHIRLLKDLPKQPESLIEDLRKKEEKRSDSFQSKADKYIKVVEKIIKSENSPGGSVTKKTIKSYFDSQIKKVDTYYKGRSYKKNTHYLRMAIKNMMYLYKVLPEKLQKYIRLNSDYLDKLQDKAGKWHDLYSAVNFYHTLKTNSLSDIVTIEQKEVKYYNSLLKELQRFNQKIYK